MNVTNFFKKRPNTLNQEPAVRTVHGKSWREIESIGGAQSKAFMVNILPSIWAYMKSCGYGAHFDVLDVGPGAAFGSEFFASLHASNFLGFTCSVDLIDIDNTYKDLIEEKHTFINKFYCANIFDFDKTYDIVICSHVIEHVDEPLKFVRRLQEIARKKVFILTPYNERKEFLAPGHTQIFTQKFTENFEINEWRLLSSIAWGAWMTPPYDMLFLQLDGKASSAT
ncbi:class I SAM-dependent methyltransferase [Brucella intermedia]|uniref:class I SAM-dependent methyltransferase n=1 Tax=Brucella intermedia TaxID=94625 RepID=UPI0005BCC39D|nr:methyltransferase domain-containing protein [Brucella intermedia]